MKLKKWRRTNNVILVRSKHERTIKAFTKGGPDNVTSAICKQQKWFGPDIQFAALVLTFNFSFSIGICTGPDVQ
jgi:hypothetical protein